MKRLAMLAGVVALGLGACGQNNGLNIGQGFGMDAQVSGGSVTVAVVEVRDKASGSLKGYRSTYTLTQPTVIFNARPQSVGLQVQNYTVEVLDNAGTRYDSDQGKYQRSASFVIKPGFVCTPATAPLDGCAPSAKVASNVATPVTGMTLITDEIASAVAGDCQTVGCPTLKLRVTITGVDDAGQNRSILINGANLSSRVTGRTVVSE